MTRPPRPEESKPWALLGPRFSAADTSRPPTGLAGDDNDLGRASTSCASPDSVAAKLLLQAEPRQPQGLGGLGLVSRAAGQGLAQQRALQPLDPRLEREAVRIFQGGQGGVALP